MLVNVTLKVWDRIDLTREKHSAIINKPHYGQMLLPSIIWQ